MRRAPNDLGVAARDSLGEGEPMLRAGLQRQLEQVRDSGGVVFERLDEARKIENLAIRQHQFRSGTVPRPPAAPSPARVSPGRPPSPRPDTVRDPPRGPSRSSPPSPTASRSP